MQVWTGESGHVSTGGDRWVNRHEHRCGQASAPLQRLQAMPRGVGSSEEGPQPFVDRCFRQRCSPTVPGL